MGAVPPRYAQTMGGGRTCETSIAIKRDKRFGVNSHSIGALPDDTQD